MGEPTRTEYGMQFGPALIECLSSDQRTGNVFIGVKTPKAGVQIRVTKSGLVRVYMDDEKPRRSRRAAAALGEKK